MGYAGQITVERSAEELLLEFERTGRPEPFEEIVRRYSGMVFHVCHRICRDRHDAEDATQAVFAALAVGRKKENGEIRTIGPWLRQVARRVSLDIRRGKSRRQRRETLCASDGSAVDPRPEPSRNGLDAEELNQLVKEELDKLPVKYRLPLILHYFGGMNQDDMAKELGCRPGTLRVRLHRGRHMLAKRLAKRGVTLGLVALAVALTRVVHAAVAESLVHHAGYAHATAGGVLHATHSGPLAVAHGVAASKLKIACAVVLIGACVVRAGAEVYEYIRPLQSQLRLPLPLNLDRLIHPLSDPIINLPRVDATPADPHPVPAIPSVTTTTGTNTPLASRAPVQSPILPTIPAIPATLTTPPLATSISPRTDYLPARVSTALRSPNAVDSNWSSTASNLTSTSSAATSSFAASSHSRPTRQPSYLGWPAETTPTPPPVPVRPPSPPPSQQSPGSTIVQTPTQTPVSGTGIALTGGIPTPAAPPVQNRRALTLLPDTKTLADVQTSVSTPPPSSAPPTQSSTLAVSSTFTMTDSVTMVTNLQAAGFTSVRTAGAADHLASYSLNLVSNVNVVTQQPRPAAEMPDPDNLYVDPPTASGDYWTYRQGNSIAKVRLNGSKLSGNGVMPHGFELDASGQVFATGNSGEPVLDLSKAGPLKNSVDNPPDRLNGWYVDPHAKMILPAVHVEVGTHAYTFGDAPDDPTPDLVNSVRLTLHDVVAAGDADLSLLSVARSDVPVPPTAVKVIGLWNFDYSDNVPGGIDLSVRYDAAAAITAGISESDLRLWRYAGAWTQIPFTQDLADHVISGRADSLTYFAVGAPVSADVPANTPTSYFNNTLAINSIITPEPGSALAIGAISLLLAGRRRKRM